MHLLHSLLHLGMLPQEHLRLPLQLLIHILKRPTHLCLRARTPLLTFSLYLAVHHPFCLHLNPPLLHAHLRLTAHLFPNPRPPSGSKLSLQIILTLVPSREFFYFDFLFANDLVNAGLGCGC